MIDHLFRRRVFVYYEGGRSAPIHVSGHGSQEEMKILLQLVKPKYFIPVHGEFRQMFHHAALAEQVGAVRRRDFPARKRPSASNSRRWRRLSARTRHGRARVRRFRLARGNRGCGDSRSPTSRPRTASWSRSSPSINTLACSKRSPEIVTRGFLRMATTTKFS